MSTQAALAEADSDLDRPKENRLPVAPEVVLVLAATALAAALRWYRIDAIPPGFYHDEAINGLVGGEIRQGRLFLLYGFDVREPLFHWLVAAGQLLWGNTVTGVRSAAALAGTLAVPVVYLLGARLFGRWVGVVAAFGVASSLWYLTLSRFGVRGVTLPLLIAITCYFLWRGIEGGGRRMFVLAGLCLGLTGYTYISSRTVPVLLAAFILWQALYQRTTLRATLGGYLLMLAVAALVFAPLGYVFLANPELFGARSGAVSLAAAPNAPQAIADSAARTLGMFVFAGDPNLRHNLGGRPVFDPIAGAFFLFGIAVAMSRWRRPAYALCLIWLPTMLLPGMLSVDSPHFIRTLGAAPAAYLFVGLGIVTVGDKLRARRARRWYPAGVALWLVWSAFATYQSYFQVWAADPAVAVAYETMLSEPARYLAEAPPGPAVVFFSEGYSYDYPQSFQYLGNRPVEMVAWHDGNSTVVLPVDGPSQVVAPGTIFLILGRNLNAERMVSALPGIRRLESKRTGQQAFSFNAYQTTEAISPWQVAYEHRAGIVVGEPVLVEGWRVVEGRPADGDEGRPWLGILPPGEKLVLQVAWRVLRPAADPDLRLFVHLVDMKGQRWAGRDVAAYSNGSSPAGERLLTWVELALPPATPPGRYELRVGAYSYADMRRLPVVDQDGKPLGDQAALGGIKIAPAGNLTPSRDLGQALDAGPRLLGYDLQRGREELRVTLYWKPSGVMTEDYTVFVHLSDVQGRLVAQHDGPPAAGAFPTSYWAPGDVVRDEHAIPLPADLPPGTYLLRAGMYQPVTGRRLPNAAGGDDLTIDTITLP